MRAGDFSYTICNIYKKRSLTKNWQYFYMIKAETELKITQEVSTIWLLNKRQVKNNCVPIAEETKYKLKDSHF